MDPEHPSKKTRTLFRRRLRSLGMYLVYGIPGVLLFVLMGVLYWPLNTVIARLYSFHIESSGFIFVVWVVLASFCGLKIAQRSGLSKWLRGDSDKNDVVTTLVTVAGIFFALVMAVIATGVWDNFKRVSETIAQEAQSAESLYRDLDGYRPEYRKHFQDLLKGYIHQIVFSDWEAQMRGIDPGPSESLQGLAREVLDFEPKSRSEQSLYPDTITEVRQLQAYRYARCHAVSLALPSVLWLAVFIGAGLSISMVYLLHPHSPRLHKVLVCALGAIVGLVLFLVLAMDHPLWGELSVQNEPFVKLLKEWH